MLFVWCRRVNSQNDVRSDLFSIQSQHARNESLGSKRYVANETRNRQSNESRKQVVLILE